jgi:hypothetical protein
METPSLPIAFSITEMSPTYGQSSIVLTWIHGPSDKWKTFVGNRVAIIQEETSAIWRHVPSQSNPAYLISRGTEPTTFPLFTLWWEGPQWSSLVLSRTHKTSSCWTTTPVSITKWKILDTKDKGLGEGCHYLLKIQGTSTTTAHGWAIISSSPNPEAIPHNWRRLCWTSRTAIGNYTLQDNNKGLYCYFCFFVCVTKAVHIEVVKSLTTEAFHAALRLFIARRGKPKTIYSDNGTNFQGASTQLHEVCNMLQFSSQMARVQDFLATEGCDLRFIPSHGPHFRLWEAAVKSVKNHLRRTLGAHVATYEELCTLLAELEACLNSRPLCALANDPLNPTYLSPGHFLIGEPLTQVPSVGYCNRLSRWQTYQPKLQHFWQRW